MLIEDHESGSIESFYSYKTLSIIITHGNDVCDNGRGRNQTSKKGHLFVKNDHIEGFSYFYYTNIHILYTITILTFT